MKNIFLTIKDSAVTDTYGNFYPDIMTFPILKFEYIDTPLKIVISSMDIERFDLFIYRYYSTSDYTDIVLWLNNYGTVHDLVPGIELSLPSTSDINKFYTKYK